MLHLQCTELIRGQPFNLRGGWGAVVFISTRLGGARKIANFITCLKRTVFEVKYSSQTESAQNSLFQKYSSPPPGD